MTPSVDPDVPAAENPSASDIVALSEFAPGPVSSQKVGATSAVNHFPEVESAAAQWDALVGTIGPNWPHPLGVNIREWVRFSRYPNYLAAYIVAGRLQAEEVPVIVEVIGEIGRAHV